MAESLAAAATHGVVFGLSSATSVLLALALARGLIRIDSVKPDARWQWSWPRMKQGMFTGIVISPAVGLTHALAYTLTHSFDLGLVHRLLFELDQGLIMGLSVGLAIGLAFALVDIDTDQPATFVRTLPPPAPARALSASLRAATSPAIVITSLAVLTVTYAAHLTSANVTEALRLNLVTPVVLAGTLTFWFTGGGV